MQSNGLATVLKLTRLYVLLVLITIVLLIIFSFTQSQLATKNAWVHAIIVAAFAILLPLRARAAQTGKRSALRATGIISSALFLVNIIEGLLPNFVPAWMRIAMFITAALMLGIIGTIVNISVRSKR